MNPFTKVTRWLHTMYPMGEVERLPVVNEDGSTRVPGLYVVGDLAGIPLLKFSQHSGTRAVANIAASGVLRQAPGDADVLDIVIIGAGIAGISAALECQRRNLRHVVLESSQLFSTIVNFPLRKPIYLYPREMTPEGELKVTGEVRETLIEELVAQVREANLDVRTGVHVTHVERRGGLLHVMVRDGEAIRARSVIVAIGRSGNFRRLDIPGEELDKVSNRLHDPAEFAGRQVLVVGGGDSAAEAAVALAQSGAAVTLSYRGEELTRPKPENVEAVQALAAEQPEPGRIRLLLGTVPKEIRPAEVVLRSARSGEETTVANDNVFSLIGREAPLEFFRRSGIPIQGEWQPMRVAAFVAFLLFCVWMYHWKAGGMVTDVFSQRGWFPFNMAGLFDRLSAASRDPATLVGTLRLSMSSPSFYYTFAYSAVIVIFGIRRIRRRRTPYVTVQTTTLALIQVVPLFLLPEILLPLLGHNGLFDSGAMRTIADNLFPAVDYGHGREYWRAVGFILAWPLFLYNAFTEQPMAWWLAIGCVQTFVLIPAMIYFWGKGAYCGWICSCGALAETLGDTHRTKMPHGPLWSRFNMAGQVILWAAVALMVLRVGGWIFPGSWAGRGFDLLFAGRSPGGGTNPVNYKWLVDLSLAGIVGVGFYFWYSGRVWCRFFCPLAALMHIYAKFSRFRIIPDKKRCISCNVCTSVCHQGIDIMNFANKGIPMEDPECVRCSACVQMCPTGVLRFGQIDAAGNVIRYDRLAASPVLMADEAQKST